ncbi:hypothetical protein VMCG_07400 [Cytospora schulzeri]|uniref:Uncharacterized protein n=1 Tax=Cytospora schulzeri TaxID=448051 RepID=A0A423W355_9PEZI|nr:hypothetical protein VMCG_07400 [Valsa malicola]
MSSAETVDPRLTINNISRLREPSSSPPPCSILTWGSTAAGDGGQQKQPGVNCERRSLVTPDDLRSEIAKLVTQRDVPLAAAATGPFFVAAAAASTTTGFDEHQQQQQQQQNQNQNQNQTQRKPLIILHGLHQPFLSLLLESPLDIDPDFVEAHAQGRRYRPRGVHRRRGITTTTTRTTSAHWDYPELVTGYRFPLWWQRQSHPKHRWTTRPVGGVDGDLAAVFYRASLWGAEGVDVLFLDDPGWWPPGDRLRRVVRGRDAYRGTRAEQGVGRGEARERGRIVPPGKGEDRTGLGDILQEAIGTGDADEALEDILEETAYDRWLEFFEALPPRRKPIVSNRIPLDWMVMEALERNTDMRKDIARRRRRRSPNNVCYPDWEGLTRRLHLRVKILATMPPPPEASTVRSSRTVPVQNRIDLPIARQPAPRDDGADENQRALDRVTYLGGILFPFSIVSGVLSMNEDFGPGHGLFWVFWVVAVPLAVLAIMVIYADKLRRLEEYVREPDVVEKKRNPLRRGTSEKRGRKGQEPPTDPGLRLSVPGDSMYHARPGAVAYSSPAEEVVIDMDTPATHMGPMTVSVEPHLPPPPVSAIPDNDQDQSGQQTSEEEESQSAGESLEESIHMSTFERLNMMQLDDPRIAAAVAGGLSHLETRYYRPRTLRTRQLGWVGAVLYMFNLRKPSLVSDGVPAGATGYPRVPVEMKRSGL